MTKKTLEQLYAEHVGKVSDKWFMYFNEYDRILDAYRNKPARLLEIGIQNGGSLEIWSKYFPNAQKLVGCDINPDCARLSYEDPRIAVVVGDANSDAVQTSIMEKAAAFDVIIDDGSHRSSDIVKSFARYFPLLADEGVFVVEDLHCSYWQEFQGGLFDPFSSITFFKRLADVVSHEHWGIEKTRADILRGFFSKYDFQIDEETLQHVHSVEFINSMCVIRKDASNSNSLGTRVITGTEGAVTPEEVLRSSQAGTPDQISNEWTARGMPPDEELLFCVKKLSERNDHVVSLKRIVAEHDEHIASLKRIVAEHDEHIASLKRIVAEREEQIVDLNRTIKEIRTSHSWRLTAPLRVIACQAYQARAAIRVFRTAIQAFGGPMALSRKVYRVLSQDGARGLNLRVKNTLNYYKATGGLPGAKPYVSGGRAQGEMPPIIAGPLISVLLPVFNTPAEMLGAAIKSIISQTYQNWELCIVDDKSTDEHVAEILRLYAQDDPRIKIRFNDHNGNISAALNTSIDMCRGDFLTVLDHDDVLDQSALYWVARIIKENPSVDYIYSDEDKISADGSLCFGPFYKPDWSPEYILSMMYTCHLGAYRTQIIRDIGGYNSEFDGAQDYDLTLRFLLRTENIIHIPKILYHWRVWENSTAYSIDAKPYAEIRARNALRNYLSARNEKFSIEDGPRPGHHKVVFMPRTDSLISIVIPTANGDIEIDGRIENHLDAVTSSIFDKSSYMNYEIVIVHNGNLREDQKVLFTKLSNVTLIHYKAKDFSLSEKINLGCATAKGEYLVIMNDDIRVITENWLERMLGMAQRDGVGVVGAKLLFPDNTIQHAGVVMLGGLPGHAYYQWPKDADGYALGVQVDRNYIAVTGACAMTPKKLFQEVGGYSDRYPLNYNDVDYCLKLHERGYRSVYMADVILRHYEGVSKEGGRSVASSEIEVFLKDWGDKYRFDPYYNPNLNQRIPYQIG